MARQIENGSWTSKLGALEDIEHADVNGLSSTEYGQVVIFCGAEESHSQLSHPRTQQCCTSVPARERGYRAARRMRATALEQLLAQTAAGTRAGTIVTPASWSIERVSYESIRSRATRAEP